MRNNYKTIKSSAIAEIIIEKSRFLAHTKRVETEEAAQDFINEIKSQHKNANHNCSAYLIGEHDNIQKANDDGEPSGTAGVPMLEVLKKQGLQDVVVVVTRYFGGIKLGGGGLIRAYGKSVTEGLSASGIVERRAHYVMKVAIDYTLLGKVENEVRASNFSLEEIKYAENVELYIYVDISQKEEFISWMTDLTSGQGEIEEIATEFVEFDK
ncbi:YigZ family protein [Paenisporosarcina cavernae]|uniref:YigZ family protein n=1 Tax=Paenisporosarcina cavernae TaxID=2320858 RepID=A0A385YR20_9BACL|nr:YigZ family protein [Paenisporosarcina cavernae]AYC28931.1 YigZ family protein [Paenisporosarcina cavernae]